MRVEATVFNLMQIGELAKESLSDEVKGAAHHDPVAAAVRHAQPDRARVLRREYEHRVGYDPDGSAGTAERTTGHSGKSRVRIAREIRRKSPGLAFGRFYDRDTAQPLATPQIQGLTTTSNRRSL